MNPVKEPAQHISNRVFHISHLIRQIQRKYFIEIDRQGHGLNPGYLLSCQALD